MIIVPGALIGWLTFPGVIVHEAVHLLFCRLAGVAVPDVRFLRCGNPAGYVAHEPPTCLRTAFLITFGPFLVNSLLCLLICFPAFMPIHMLGVTLPFNYVLLWLGVSIGMHAFPSGADARALLAQARREAAAHPLLALLSYPWAGAVCAANLLSVVWLDYLYGLGIGLGLPALVFQP